MLITSKSEAETQDIYRRILDKERLEKENLYESSFIATTSKYDSLLPGDNPIYNFSLK